MEFFEQTLNFETRLGLPEFPLSKLDTILEKRAGDHPVSMPRGLGPEEIIWKSDFFHLQRSTFYNDLNENSRFQILRRLNQEILEEIIFIERCGMYYAAKMGLLSESIQERTMFGLVGADECQHYLWISALAGPVEPLSFRKQPFIKFLDEILFNEEKNILIAVIQVILEGWGLRHYRKLADGSHNPEATLVLKQIIKDEAYHHGAGLVLFNPEKQNIKSNFRLQEILEVFFDMIRCGPQRVLQQLENERGQLSKSERVQFFSEVKATEEAQNSLDFLKGLIQSTKIPRSILERLEAKSRFVPYSENQCAEMSNSISS